MPINTTQFTIKDAQTLYMPRLKDSHKGDFGHALLMVGSENMMGAAVLSTGSCMRSGVGLTTVKVPNSKKDVIYLSVPEAIVAADNVDFAKYNAMGIGCGFSTGNNALAMVDMVLNSKDIRYGIVFDADALNIIARRAWLSRLPKNAIITPHEGEFDRLFPFSKDSIPTREERIKKAIEMAQKLSIVIVLKGYQTAVIATDGSVSINTTGNAGMATAGSGDVLLGLITGLIARGYSPYDAARMGVFLHGLAGDLATQNIHPECLIASDIIHYLSKAFNLVAMPSASMPNML